ncbi:MAG: Bacteriophage Mu Gam like protein [Candidatus Saccharibacteria bacterium]|nr:Bacteriophage Mu Gam like protein [Candidatus Saccharibacteria bacterium]
MTDPKQTVAEVLNADLENLAALRQKRATAVAEMNNQVATTKKTHQDAIDKIDQDIATTTSSIETTATENRMLLTNNGAKKTISLRAGKIAWRNSTGLVFDFNDQRLLRLIRRLGGMRRFVKRKPSIQKDAIKKDDTFVSQLIQRGAAHWDRSETLTIEPISVNVDLLEGDNPLKIKSPREE